jgi:hypothetical protein
VGSRYNARIQGTHVRHSMGMASIKKYDKFGHILGIETTMRDVSRPGWRCAPGPARLPSGRGHLVPYPWGQLAIGFHPVHLRCRTRVPR